MKRLLQIVCLVFACFALDGEASTVLWNVFESYSSSAIFYDGPSDHQGTVKPTFNVYYYYNDFGTPEIGFAYETIGTQNKLYSSANASWNIVNVGHPNALWVLASAGDVLESLADYQAKEVIFNCLSEWDFSSDKTGTISLSAQTQTYYLALLGELIDDGYYWGWVELTGNRKNGLSLVSSAVSADGPLIVGGGLAHGSIPEPTGGLLSLLGASVLCLCRNGCFAAVLGAR